MAAHPSAHPLGDSPIRNGARRSGAIHVIHSAISAASFIVPVVKGLRAQGIDAELWTEPHSLRHPALQGVEVPVRAAVVDLRPSPWAMLRGFWGLVVALRRRRPQVVHAHQTRAALIPLAAAAVCGVPIRIYHNHGLPYLGYSGPLRWALRLCERLNCALATRVLLVAPSNLDSARQDGLFSGLPARVLGSGSICGIDLEDYPPPDPERSAQARRAQALPQGAFVLGWVGRPFARKGLPLLLTAWSASEACRNGGCLLIAGCTDEECRQLHGELPPGVRALGYVSDMPGFYRLCDAVAQVSAHEGFSYALLEGAAAGAALLGSDIPGIRDSIIDGRTGLLTARTVAAVGAAIDALARDRRRCQAMGSAARERVIAQFDRRQVIAEMCRFYIRELGVSRG